MELGLSIHSGPNGLHENSRLHVGKNRWGGKYQSYGTAEYIYYLVPRSFQLVLGRKASFWDENCLF